MVKDNTQFCIVVSLMIMMLILTVSYFFQSHDLIWLYTNDYDIGDIGNKNIIYNRTQIRNYMGNEIEKYEGGQKPLLLIFDSAYLPLNQDEMKKFLNKDFTDIIQYKNDVRDCDDFSMIMYVNIHRTQPRYYEVSLALGVISGDTEKDSEYSHMINFFIEDEENKLICFEPQSDKMDECSNFFVKIHFFII
jgi:hypothetical protein